MTNQEIFDIVVAHARNQDKRAIHEGRCQYRTPEKHKCFAGALIKDEFYDPSMEGLSCGTAEVEQALERSGVLPDQMTLVYKLQTVHDRYLVSEWPREFTGLALDEGLVYENDPA